MLLDESIRKTEHFFYNRSRTTQPNRMSGYMSLSVQYFFFFTNFVFLIRMKKWTEYSCVFRLVTETLQCIGECIAFCLAPTLLILRLQNGELDWGTFEMHSWMFRFCVFCEEKNGFRLLFLWISISISIIQKMIKILIFFILIIKLFYSIFCSATDLLRF